MNEGGIYTDQTKNIGGDLLDKAVSRGIAQADIDNDGDIDLIVSNNNDDANLLINEGATRLIDFDDCGLGWFMYDFAAGISFIEDDPQVPALKEAWINGYRKVRQLSDGDENEIDTFIMLRRLALLAWIGSHIEVDTAKELAPVFAPVTRDLAEKFLADMG